jgi:exosortase/archaeosortase family protein
MPDRLCIASAWSRPTGRFLIRVSALMLLFLVAYRDDLLGRLLGPWEELTARMTLALLQALKIEAVRFGSQIHHPGGFAYEIYYRCTGVLPAALLAALTAATPASLRSKLIGVGAGIPLLVALNLLRLVQLFHTGVYHPARFSLVHGPVWELLLMLATLGIWWRWSRWARHSNPSGRKWDGPV